MYFAYTIAQYHVQKKMHEALKNDATKFQTITLSLADYKKSKINSHEISIDGKMYDVKSVTFRGNKVDLACINDREEENILKDLKDFASRSSKSNSNLPNQIQQLLTLNYITPEAKEFYFIPIVAAHIFLSSNPGIVSNDTDITTPPPKLG